MYRGVVSLGCRGRGLSGCIPRQICGFCLRIYEDDLLPGSGVNLLENKYVIREVKIIWQINQIQSGKWAVGDKGFLDSLIKFESKFSSSAVFVSFISIFFFFRIK